FELAIFSAKSCALRIIDNPEGERLASMMKREKYVCGVNGGYFDEQFKPIGLRIVNSQMLTHLRRARRITDVLFELPRGVLSVRATTPMAADVEIQGAVNRDGGSSSAFWFARENASVFSISERKSVRDFVSVLPK